MGIEISIRAGLDQSSSSVTASGSEQHIISDVERNTFGLNDDQLKNAVAKYFGQRPDDAFLHSPTPWNDLYKTYGWDQVQTVLVVDSATVTGITSNPEIVAQQTFKNNSSVAGNFDCSISQSVSNTTENSWSETDTITVGQKFTYNVSFLGEGGGGETSFEYSHAWGQTQTESMAVTLGRSQGVTVTLNPGQSVLAVLTASRGTMKVRINYRAYLIGSTAINYGGTYQGHHFWALPIQGVMAAAGIANSQTFTEDIEIGFYSNSTVEIKDPQSGQVRTSLLAAAVPGVQEKEPASAR